jgi:uncharacterized SAM-binding protein YcdF (DUF218 family)
MYRERASRGWREQATVPTGGRVLHIPRHAAHHPGVIARSIRVDRIASAALILAVAFLLVTTLAFDLFSRQAIAAIVIGALVGALVGALAAQWRPLLWTLFALACAAWLVVIFTPVARVATRGLVRADDHPTHADAVIVLSAGVSDDGLLGQEAVDRLLAAMSLVRAGVSDTLVLTVWHATDHPEVTSARDELRIATLLPPGVTIVQVGRIGTTRLEAVRIASVLPPARMPHVVVVTSPLHTRRACATFERVGYRVSCVPALSRDLALGALASARDRVITFRMAVYEQAALVKYRWEGWI